MIKVLLSYFTILGLVEPFNFSFCLNRHSSFRLVWYFVFNSYQFNSLSFTYLKMRGFQFRITIVKHVKMVKMTRRFELDGVRVDIDEIFGEQISGETKYHGTHLWSGYFFRVQILYYLAYFLWVHGPNKEPSDKTILIKYPSKAKFRCFVCISYQK